ncbi:hypothetical protein SOPP22_01580 [Shewanella sp. OPT22]|nr:hypothetical protein SOPP22_01580 [Shewanella sp. OPT22]
MSARFDDESYAKEELRAEIGSLILGDELQIGHEFGQHAAYVDHWVKVLQDDPKEIIRASRDAEKINDFVMGFEKQSSNMINHQYNINTIKSISSEQIQSGMNFFPDI